LFRDVLGNVITDIVTMTATESESFVYKSDALAFLGETSPEGLLGDFKCFAYTFIAVGARQGNDFVISLRLPQAMPRK